MDRITYAGETFLTGSAIAHALLDFAQALAQVGSSATVTIPTVSETGESVSSEVLVGPASQLITTEVSSDFDEPLDAALVERIRALAEEQRRGPIAHPYSEDTPPTGDFSEYGI